MTFNQVIWDVLCFALEHGAYNTALEALYAYAAEHDGQLVIEARPGRQNEYKFIPNPIGKY
jgi:hypothetical protein